MSFPIFSNKDLDHLLEQNYRVFLVDLRTPDLYKKERILGSVNIPFDQLEERKGEIPKNCMVIFICDRGAKSMLVCRDMSRMGYCCGDLGGGIINYRGKYIDRTPLMDVK